MLLSRKADYALVAVRYLSGLPKGAVSSIDRIAQNASIPREFLAKILKELSGKNILESIRGAKGGYRLVLKPRNITYQHVIEAVDGPIYLNLCTEFGRSYCNKIDECEIHQFWLEQEAIFKRELSKQNFGRYAARAN